MRSKLSSELSQRMLENILDSEDSQTFKFVDK